eukprot:5415210-Prymnesium_polylepis.3
MNSTKCRTCTHWSSSDAAYRIVCQVKLHQTRDECQGGKPDDQAVGLGPMLDKVWMFARYTKRERYVGRGARDERQGEEVYGQLPVVQYPVAADFCPAMPSGWRVSAPSRQSDSTA